MEAKANLLTKDDLESDSDSLESVEVRKAFNTFKLLQRHVNVIRTVNNLTLVNTMNYFRLILDSRADTCVLEKG